MLVPTLNETSMADRFFSQGKRGPRAKLHTQEEKGQNRKRWGTVSSWCLHREHREDPYIPLLLRFSGQNLFVKEDPAECIYLWNGIVDPKLFPRGDLSGTWKEKSSSKYPAFTI